jgi:hypothetical protein
MPAESSEQEQEQEKPKKKGAWKPKKWKVAYERMVLMSAYGMSAKMIGQELGYTREHVATILNMEEAEKIRMILLEKLRAKAMVEIPTGLEQIAKKTVNLLLNSFENEELIKKNPLALVDRGLDVVKGLGHLRGGGNGANGGLNINSQGGNVLVLQGEQVDDLAQALKKANEVKQLHAGAVKELPATLVKEKVNGKK